LSFDRVDLESTAAEQAMVFLAAIATRGCLAGIWSLYLLSCDLMKGHFVPGASSPRHFDKPHGSDDKQPLLRWIELLHFADYNPHHSKIAQNNTPSNTKSTRGIMKVIPIDIVTRCRCNGDPQSKGLTLLTPNSMASAHVAKCMVTPSSVSFQQPL
jgi:hypothetical protein